MVREAVMSMFEFLPWRLVRGIEKQYKKARIFSVLSKIRGANFQIQVRNDSACVALLLRLYKTVREKEFAEDIRT
jgi:ABC-type transporter Mla MlaB component